jgi:Flp pilus assembly pilin Flp
MKTGALWLSWPDRIANIDESRGLVGRLLGEESGQDIVEYALLGALVGVAAILIWQQLVARVGVVYVQADTGVQGLSACTPDPGGGGC